MFDPPANLPVEPESNDSPFISKPPSAAGPKPNPPLPSIPPSNSLLRPPKKEPEDIFSGVEHDASAGGAAPVAAPEVRASSGRGKGKIILIASIVVGVLLLAAGGYFLYKRFMVSPTPAVKKPTTTSPTVPSEQPAAPAPDAATGAPITPPATGSSEPAVPPTPPPAIEHTSSTQAVDTDGDGLSDAEEAKLGTDPNSPDTDGDGLTDGAEVNTYHTNPLVADTDGDGLTDGDEVNVWHTDPTKADTDGDGFSDGQEVQNGFNPLGPGKLKK